MHGGALPQFLYSERQRMKGTIMLDLGQVENCMTLSYHNLKVQTQLSYI